MLLKTLGLVSDTLECYRKTRWLVDFELGF